MNGDEIRDHITYCAQHKRAKKYKAIWSVEQPKDFATAHPYTGAHTLVYTQHWGGEPVEVQIHGKTWDDLYKAADQAITLSKDTHHVFIEDFKAIAEGVLTLSTGS